MGEKALGGQVGQVISALEITDPNCGRREGRAGRSPPSPPTHSCPTHSDVNSRGLPPSPAAHSLGQVPPVGTAVSAADAQPRVCQE